MPASQPGWEPPLPEELQQSIPAYEILALPEFASRIVYNAPFL